MWRAWFLGVAQKYELRVSYSGYNKGLFLLSSYIVLDYYFEKVILSILNLHVLVQ